MARLPIPGNDNGTWGDVLNEFLGVEHNSDGTLKTGGSLAAKVNSADLAAVATSGNYSDLAGKPATVVQSVAAGANVTVDATDPQNPIISTSPTQVAGVQYYLRKGDADESIASYNKASSVSALDVENSVALALASGDNLFATFVTRPGEPGVAMIHEGFWETHLYYKVSGTGGTNTLRMDTYQRTPAGTETLLFSIAGTEDLASTAQTDTQIEYQQNEPISINSADRLVFKLYIVHTGGSSPTFTIYFNGSTHPTHVSTPIITTPIVPAPRIATITTATSVSPDISVSQQLNITALASALSIGQPTGTPVDGYNLMIRIKDDGSSRALNWHATYRAFGAILPAATQAGKTMYARVAYNASEMTWDVLTVYTQI